MRLNESGNGKNVGLKKEVDLLLGRGELPRALRLIEEASRANPSDWYPAYLQGWIHQADHQAGKALKAYRKAEELSLDNPQLKAVIGELLLARGEAELAIPYLEECVRQWPTSSEAHSLYGTALLHTNNFDEAETVLTESRELSEHNPDARASLVGLYEQTSRPHLIKPLLEAYTQEAPDLASSQTFMADHVFYQEGDCEGACPYYEKGLERYFTSPNPGWFKQYMSTVNYPNTIVDSYLDALMNCEYFELAVKVAREHLGPAQAMAWQAEILHKQGDNGAAAKLIGDAIEADPEEPGLRAAKAKHLLLNNKPGAAEEEIRAAINMAERIGVEEAWYWGILAISLVEQDRMEEAEEYIGQIDPKDRDRLYASMIFANAELGHWEAVIEICQQVLEDDPNKSVALHFLAKAYMGLDQAPIAVEAYERVLKHQPNNGRAQYELGMTYQKAGLNKEAISTFERALISGNLSQPQRKATENELKKLLDN